MYISYSGILMGLHTEGGLNEKKKRKSAVRLPERAPQELDTFSECFDTHSPLTGSSTRHDHDRILLCEWKES